MPLEMPKLFITRHGDTAWTESRQRTGRTDIPLNQAGEERAAANRREAAAILARRRLHQPVASRLEDVRVGRLRGGGDGRLRTWSSGSSGWGTRRQPSRCGSCSIPRSSWPVRCGPSWSNGPGDPCRGPDGPLASPEDFAIPICCRTGPEVLDVLHDHHSRWKANREATS